MSQNDSLLDSVPPADSILDSQSATADKATAITLLGGLELDGLDELLPGGVYAIVPQSPPARFPLWAMLLKAAMASGRVCHVLLRTDPAEFLERLSVSGWPEAQAAWLDETLRIYPMVDGFSKLLFRRDVAGLTEELVGWGVQSTDFLLVDAADELLSLHDLFLATGQIIKFKAWVKAMRLPVLLNFSLAGAGSGMTSLTSLMDHFSGLARLHSDDSGSLITLEYWQSAMGTVAERTVTLTGETQISRPRESAASWSSMPPPMPPSRSPAPAFMPGMPHPSATAPAAAMAGNFTNDDLWARELQMLTGEVWQALASTSEICAAAQAVSSCQILLRYARNTVLEELARDVDFLRTQLPPSARIVVAEHRAALRYPNELMLMKLGADAVIHQDIAMGRWPVILKTLQAQPGQKQEKLSIDTAFASAAASREMGFLELPHFLREVQSIMSKAQLMGVPFAMAVLSTHNGQVTSDFIAAAHVRRQGDLLTTDGQRLFVFFYGCSFTLGPQVLENIFEGRLTDFVAETDWMASELDIRYLIQYLEAHGGQSPSEPAAAAVEGPAVPNEAHTTQADAVATVLAGDDAGRTGQQAADAAESAGEGNPVGAAEPVAAIMPAPAPISSPVTAPAPAPVPTMVALPPAPVLAPSSPAQPAPNPLLVPLSAGAKLPDQSLKKLAIRVTEVVPHQPPETPLVVVPERRKQRSNDPSFVVERRVADLIRRLAHPAGRPPGGGQPGNGGDKP